MGNHRFRLSDMMPNAWFYKLKDMSKGRRQHTGRSSKKKVPLSTTPKSNVSQQRYSYHFKVAPNKVDKRYNSPVNPKASDTHFPQQPRASSNRRSERKTIYKPSQKLVSSSLSSPGCSCHAADNSVWTGSVPDHSVGHCSSSSLGSSPELNFHESLQSESGDDDGFGLSGSFDRQVALWSTSRNCKFKTSETDIIIDVKDECRQTEVKRVEGHDTMISDPELHPFVTKPEKFEDKEIDSTKTRKRSSKMKEPKAGKSVSVKIVKEESNCRRTEKNTNHPIRKVSSNYAGIRVGANSPRFSSRKIQVSARKGMSSSRNKILSESFAVVKSSADPHRDFRDSMVEMIVENKIRASKDLEDLLACYLSLNSNENHDLIVKAFEDIWINMTGLQV